MNDIQRVLPKLSCARKQIAVGIEQLPESELKQLLEERQSLRLKNMRSRSLTCDLSANMCCCDERMAQY